MLDDRLCTTLMFPVAALVKPLFSVPFERDVSFIDRKHIFAQIERQLYMHHRASICGLGGVGYTFSLNRPS